MTNIVELAQHLKATATTFNGLLDVARSIEPEQDKVPAAALRLIAGDAPTFTAVDTDLQALAIAIESLRLSLAATKR